MPVSLAHPLDELAAVDRPAAGLGRDRARQRNIAAAQLLGADRKRRDRAVHRLLGQLPVCDRPSPSRTMREKASTTVKPPSIGRAISRRQLLVPRSTAP